MFGNSDFRIDEERIWSPLPNMLEEVSGHGDDIAWISSMLLMVNSGGKKDHMA